MSNDSGLCDRGRTYTVNGQSLRSVATTMALSRVRGQADIAALSAMRLARLERPHEIRAYRVSDEVLVCGGCGFVIVESPEGWRHSQAEIDAMRYLASDGRWRR